MAELNTMKLNPESHILLDQPLLRLPYELSRNNFRTAHRQLEQTQTKVDDILKATLKNANNTEKCVTSLDQAINRLQTLKRKLSSLNESQASYSQQSLARIRHLDELYHIESPADVKYDEWSKTRLDRLMVDYLARHRFMQTARELAADRKIENLTDVEEFEGVAKIESSLRRDRRVDLALAWYGENKQTLKKMDCDLEYQLRLQQYIEMIRSGRQDNLHEAVLHARKYLIGNTQTLLGIQSAGLLAFHSGSELNPYSNLFSSDRWNQLADDFLKAHHKIYSLPTRPLLHIALTAGLSALKTPACHSKYVSPTSGLNTARSPPPTSSFEGGLEGSVMQTDEPERAGTSLLNTPVCPICSTELNKLAKNVPFAHHSKSHVESDPIVLPNGRIYGRERLLAMNQKLKTPDGYVRDPVEPDQMYDWRFVRKVFIS